jgi:two-component system sensor histidine kinase UhpB
LLDPDNASGLSDDLATDGLFRTLAAPLSAKQELFGALVISSLREDEPLNLKDAALLMAFAQQVATFVENARLYQVVQERETQLGQLVRQLVNAQEGERQRIARELHDETGQKLSALAMGLAAVETQLAAGDRSRPVGLVQNLRQVADHALTELRNVMANLRPSQLDDLGLAPALHWYIQQHAVRHPQTNITFTAERLAQRLPAEYETVLFRAAQETLTNVARHAHATQVTVALSQQSDAVRLEVVDNGVGFDIKSPVSPEHQGWGLIGMRERVALVGGVCTVESQPGKGTRIVIELPQRQKEA